MKIIIIYFPKKLKIDFNIFSFNINFFLIFKKFLKKKFMEDFLQIFILMRIYEMNLNIFKFKKY